MRTKPRSRSELPMTETSLNAMAPAASIGLSCIPRDGNRTPAATGIKRHVVGEGPEQVLPDRAPWWLG